MDLDMVDIFGTRFRIFTFHFPGRVSVCNMFGQFNIFHVYLSWVRSPKKTFEMEFRLVLRRTDVNSNNWWRNWTIKYSQIQNLTWDWKFLPLLRMYWEIIDDRPPTFYDAKRDSRNLAYWRLQYIICPDFAQVYEENKRCNAFIKIFQGRLHNFTNFTEGSTSSHSLTWMYVFDLFYLVEFILFQRLKYRYLAEFASVAIFRPDADRTPSTSNATYSIKSTYTIDFNVFIQWS